MGQNKIIFCYDWFVQFLFSTITSFFLDVCRWAGRLMVLNTTNLFCYYTEICWLVLSTVIFWTIFLFYNILCTIFDFFLRFNIWIWIVTFFIFWQRQWPCSPLKRKVVKLAGINSFDGNLLCVCVCTFDVFFSVCHDCLVTSFL